MPTIGDRYMYEVSLVPFGHGLGPDPSEVPVGTLFACVVAPDEQSALVVTRANLGTPLDEAGVTAAVDGWGRGVDLAYLAEIPVSGTGDPDPPPPGEDEPFFGDDAADVSIWADDFDAYDSITGGSTPMFANYSTRVNPNEPNTLLALPTGRGGSGKCVEMKYGAEQAKDIVIEKGLSSPSHLFFQYWFRTTPNWNPSNHRSDGIKGLMLEGANTGSPQASPRYQWGVNRLHKNESCAFASPSFASNDTRVGIDFGRTAVDGPFCAGFVWEGRQNDREPVPWMNGSASAANSPWPNGLNDGAWHRYTLEIKSEETGDGGDYERHWFDGVLAFDSSGNGLHLRAPTKFAFFGNYADEAGAMNGSIFFDDLRAWRR